MKIFFTAFLLLATFEGQSQTSTFTSQKYSYTINKPIGFDYKTAIAAHTDFKIADFKDGSGITVNVSKRLPEEKGMDGYSYSREYFENTFKQFDPNTIISQTEKIIIDGKKTFLIYYTYTSKTGTKFMVIEAYLFVGNNAYLITATSDNLHYENHKAIFLETIKSIKF